MNHNYTDTELQAAIDEACNEVAHLQQTQLSKLRPLSEAGAVPEGCLRFYTYKKDGEWTPATKHRAMQDTHYIDIRLPESEPLVTKPISLTSWTPAVGDVVTLKSGGPKMTIRAFDRDDPMEAWCHWFKDEKSCAETFPTTCLQPV